MRSKLSGAVELVVLVNDDACGELASEEVARPEGTGSLDELMTQMCSKAKVIEVSEEMS